jgi:3-isopropylmalate dehydratase small subunit
MNKSKTIFTKVLAASLVYLTYESSMLSYDINLSTDRYLIIQKQYLHTIHQSNFSTEVYHNTQIELDNERNKIEANQKWVAKCSLAVKLRNKLYE